MMRLTARAVRGARFALRMVTKSDQAFAGTQGGAFGTAFLVG